MARKVTLMTAQWADMPFEEMCTLAKKMGYDGLEIACWEIIMTLTGLWRMTTMWAGSRRT